MTTPEFLTSEAPDPEAARRFLQQLEETHPSKASSLRSNAGLLSDVQVLVSCSPLFATTLLQYPEYLTWLDRERTDTKVRDKQTLLESLARFALVHSGIEANVVLSRFRRRELMRIFLRDVRRLATVAEITQEVSNLADAILEYSLRLSTQELDNRFGQPQEQDARGRLRRAEFCVISLGKLGSKELNYSSDIDLLFIFSNGGMTSSSEADAATNFEYFSKLTQAIMKLVGGQGGEGAAYRVDMRLRPHGRVGPLALSLVDTVRYYRSEAAVWERQVLIRSRVSAGSEELFRKFFAGVEDRVFSAHGTIEAALENVRLSKEKIDLQKSGARGTDIKLGRGGIREIEFIAQALQLAHGGIDKWLRVPHTLVSLDRLADRGHISASELTQLFDAYDFLRRLEHILQIENGLQIHVVPHDKTKRASIAKRLGSDAESFEADLEGHTESVSTIFHRVFNQTKIGDVHFENLPIADSIRNAELPIVERIKDHAPRFLEVVIAHPEAIQEIADIGDSFPERDYFAIGRAAIATAADFGKLLCELRRFWYRQLIEIVVFDAFGKLELAECKRHQTRLAEASIEIALEAAANEADKRFGNSPDRPSLAVLALGKLGSGGMDYDSDLDLVFVHNDEAPLQSKRARSRDRITTVEYYSRVIEVFTTILSSVTRDGSLYRVDLRLRPYGNDGPLVISRNAIVDYFRNDAAIWELLAYVNLRAVGVEMNFAARLESEIWSVIHKSALKIGPNVLAAETRLMRDKLENQKTKPRSRVIDIKFGPGGLLDVYFVVRYLQLRFGLRNELDRSTMETLERAKANPAIRHVRSNLCSLHRSYDFLSNLDHKLRLKAGRSARVSSNDPSVEELTTNRLAIREAFEQILAEKGR